jgi:hypothetical protein
VGAHCTNITGLFLGRTLLACSTPPGNNYELAGCLITTHDHLRRRWLRERL